MLNVWWESNRNDSHTCGQLYIYPSLSEQDDRIPPKCGKQSEYTGYAHTEVDIISLRHMNESHLYD